MPAALIVALAIHGQVYVDTNRDGRPSAGEPGVPNAVVAFEVATFVVADAGGQFDLVLPDTASGNVWVRVPDGYEPGPVWQHVDAKTTTLDLGVRPAAPRTGPAQFVVAADTHLSPTQPFSLDLRDVASRATMLDPPPVFFTILGDITQGNQEAEFDLVDASLAGLGVPFVPVPGNHDWYDGGAAWFRRYGPDNYSFDLDGIHFVVWNMAMSERDIREYLARELDNVDPKMPIVALTHGPPAAPIVDVLHDLGVDYVLTGHVHANHVDDHDGIVELGTEPLLMGGLDFSVAGYRVITLNGDRLVSEHRTITTTPQLAIVSPMPGACAGDEVIVASDATAPIRARLDCATPIELTRAGGWTWKAKMPPLAIGSHAIAVGPSATMFRACAPIAPKPLVPPLEVRWTSTIGGHAIAAPVYANGTVYATATDLADGNTGGIAALDATTGARIWRVATPTPVRGSVAVVTRGSTMMSGTTSPTAVEAIAYAGIDGAVVALDPATGAQRWRTEVGTQILGGPTADGGGVIAGSLHAIAALDGATGTPEWTIDPMPHDDFDFAATAALGTGAGYVIGTTSRALGGVVALDRSTGALAWRLEGVEATAVNSTPLIDRDTVFLTNGSDEALAVDLATGAIRWRTPLDPAGFEWGNAIGATPALARGVLVVPTLYTDLVALDAGSGAELWRYAARVGPLRTTHYRGAGEAGFAGSPLIVDDIVYAADTSGRVVALDLRDGRELFALDLGIPVMAGPIRAGDAIVVASYDGSIRALAGAMEREPMGPVESCEVASGSGCCSTGTGPVGPITVSLYVAYWLSRRRHRARERSA